MAEVRTFGAPPLLSAIVRTVCDCGVRPAEPGEFTLRAFLAGRIDLPQAEAVLGVIDSAGSEQLKIGAGPASRGMNNLRRSSGCAIRS